MKNKRFLSMVMAIVLAVSLFAGISVTASADGEILDYAVKSGDYLFKICRNQGLDYYACKSAIMALNGFTSETQLNRIYVGQTIKLPASNAVAATVTTTTVTTTSVGGKTVNSTTTTSVAGGDSVYCYLVPHTVVSGETLASICNGLGTSYDQWKTQILEMNNIKSVTHVWAGKTVYIPVNSAPASGTYLTVVAHKVQSGDTMTSICNSMGIGYNANYSLINGINKDVNLNYIKVGQTVYVPTSKAVSNGGGGSSSGESSGTTVNTGNDISLVIVSGSGSGSPQATVNGSVVSKAQKGTTVTINGCANNGYAMEIDSITRADKKANVSCDGNSFVMPDCGVTVKVKYVAAKAVLKVPATNGTFETLVDGFGVNYAKAGAKVIIKAYPDAAFEAGTPAVTKKSDNSAVPVTAKTDGTWFFTMPDDDVKVKVAFSGATLYTLTGNVTGNGTVKFSVNGTSCTAAAANTTVTVTGTPKNSKYKVTAVTYGTVGNEFKADESSSNVWTFTMPAKDTKVAVSFAVGTAYKITCKSLTGGGSALFEVAGTVQTIALPTQTVTVIPQSDGFHEFKDCFVRYASTGATVPMSGKTFTMPEADVDVYVQYNESNYTYRNIYQIGDVGFKVEVSKDGGSTWEQSLKAYAGCVVKVTPAVDCTKVEARLEDGSFVGMTKSGSSYTITMPDYDLGIKGTGNSAEKWVAVTIGTHTNGDIEVLDENNSVILDSELSLNSASVLAGKKLVIKIVPKSEDYAASSIQLKVNGTDKPLVISDNYTYTINKADNTIEINATFVAN